MTATSSIPAVIDALVAGLRARPALQQPGYVVSDGRPVNLTGKHLITIGGQTEPTASGSQVPASTRNAGGVPKTEDYTLRVYCSSVAPSQKAARDIAFDLMAEVEQYVQANRTLGGVINLNAQVSGQIELQQSSEDPTTQPDGRRWAEVSLDIRITNRLS